MKHFEVIVVGAGPAGSVAALTLARAGRSVLLLDRERENLLRIGESLPSAARLILSDLNLLHITDGHALSYGQISAWGSDQLQLTDSIRDPHGPGWHLDRARFDRDLRSEAQRAGASYIKSGVESVLRLHDHIQLRTSSQEFQAGWIIDATGRGAPLARQLGGFRRQNESLMAVHSWSANDVSSEQRTLIEAVCDGWWYTSKIPNGARVFSFHSDVETVRRVANSQEKWLELLGQSKYASRYIRHQDEWLSFGMAEASGSLLTPAYGDRWLAVGDAALAFDPLSSQGIFNSLYTGRAGAQALLKMLNADTSALPAYSSQLAQIWKIYVSRRNHFYAAETRWPDSPFWQRRLRAA